MIPALLLLPVIIGVIAGIAWIIQNQPEVFPLIWMAIKWGGIGYMALRVMIWLAGPFSGSLPELSEILPINDARHKIAEIDRNGSVIAYRYFQRHGEVLLSLGAGQIGNNPITGRNRGSYRGGWNISDRVPTLKNTSGIYAAKTWNSPILEYYNDGRTVLAKVELSGKVIEGEYGYRAQRCRILEVYED